MEQIVAKLVSEFERGKLSRRQLIRNLTAALMAGAGISTAASAVAAAIPAAATPKPAAAAEDNQMQALYINHVSYQVKDYGKSRDFYANLFNMKVTEDDGKMQCRLLFGDNILEVRNAATRPNPTIGVDHIAYTIADWDTQQKSYLEEVTRRGLKLFMGSNVLDPDGRRVQFGGFKQ